ncbi:porin [Ancylomarina longa]|uniref:Porin n=1 Tax=Ancylomarina longa TaxID=2487017 RepID=A0A434AGU1_9BACT|nr:porin [Ancylomarina longa]RUT73615.1 hypothetical protein DLK05_12365 [Ancylomarina longa]
MRVIFFLLLFLFNFSSYAQLAEKKQVVDWNGYAQIRYSSGSNGSNSFAMRRMKLWIHSGSDFQANWGFKVQTTLTSFQNEKFTLQDAFAFYKMDNLKITFGQFVPNYSMQRFQHDYHIPLMERTHVINALIPNGTLGVRDIGIEGNIHNGNKNIESWLGLFNGYGTKEYRSDNKSIMITNKTVFHLLNKHFDLGYSAMYRKASQLQLLKILPDSLRFSGNDFRYNLFAKYNLKSFQIQTEYLYARLNRAIADGYYILASLKVRKSQFSISWEKYSDLIKNTDDSPLIHLGYNYLINKDKLKLMFDNGFKLSHVVANNYFASIQMQIFFQ